MRNKILVATLSFLTMMTSGMAMAVMPSATPASTLQATDAVVAAEGGLWVDEAFAFGMKNIRRLAIADEHTKFIELRISPDDSVALIDGAYDSGSAAWIYFIKSNQLIRIGELTGRIKLVGFTHDSRTALLKIGAADYWKRVNGKPMRITEPTYFYEINLSLDEHTIKDIKRHEGNFKTDDQFRWVPTLNKVAWERKGKKVEYLDISTDGRPAKKLDFNPTLQPLEGWKRTTDNLSFLPRKYPKPFGYEDSFLGRKVNLCFGAEIMETGELTYRTSDNWAELDSLRNIDNGIEISQYSFYSLASIGRTTEGEFRWRRSISPDGRFELIPYSPHDHHDKSDKMGKFVVYDHLNLYRQKWMEINGMFPYAFFFAHSERQVFFTDLKSGDFCVADYND